MMDQVYFQGEIWFSITAGNVGLGVVRFDRFLIRG